MTWCRAAALARALRGAAALALAIGLGTMDAATVRAGTEEFSTFDVERQEQDDESLLDHLLTRPPRAWQGEWERSPQALRSSQGCLTSGQWFIETRLKLRAPLGERARFGLDLRQDESDRSSYTFTDFSFRFPTPWGTPGAMFRPLFDKARQDFAVFWEGGADTAAWLARGTFTFEDVFNNLWAFRQTRVGEDSEPYERHPFEPALDLKVSRPAYRGWLEGRYLTPSRKRLATPTGDRLSTLWGTLGAAGVEAGPERLRWELHGANRQASGTDGPADASAQPGHDFRRQWWIETALRTSLTPRLEAEARWLYQDRAQNVDLAPLARTFHAVDRVFQVEAAYRISEDWGGRLGVLHDRIGVAQTGGPLPFSYGTRTESRAYVGLAVRFGRVRVHAVEGFELDDEPYEVWLVHDKAFLHLQTTF